MSPQKSTIVRVKFAAIRAAFGSLERVAPGLGARWAERIWLAIPEYRGRRPPDVIPPGDPFTVTVDGRRVRGRVWGSGPVVYLVHGRGGIGIQLRSYLEPLLAAGHRVVTFDAPGHGRSDPGPLGPGRISIPDLAGALTAVAAAHGPAHAVIAHSLGCASTFFALRNGLPAGRLVFLAPMTQPVPYVATLGAHLGWGERIAARTMERVARRVGHPWSAFDMPSHLDGMALPPLLAVHDPNDSETRYADSVAITKAWPDSTLRTVHGLGHWRVLHDADTVRQAVGFVTTARTTDRAAAG